MNYFDVPEIIARMTGQVSPDTVRSVFVAVFVFSIEPWLWFMRIRKKIAFGCVDKLEQKYSIRFKK